MMLDQKWRIRLKGAIEAQGASMRAVSLASGSGPGYIHSILNEGKEPSLERFFAICDAIPANPVHILLGVDAKPDDLKLLKILHENPEKRASILALLGA